MHHSYEYSDLNTSRKPALLNPPPFIRITQNKLIFRINRQVVVTSRRHEFLIKIHEL